MSALILFVFLGAVGQLHLVWSIADTLNGLMAVRPVSNPSFSTSPVIRAERSCDWNFFSSEVKASPSVFAHSWTSGCSGASRMKLAP